MNFRATLVTHLVVLFLVTPAKMFAVVSTPDSTKISKDILMGGVNYIYKAVLDDDDHPSPPSPPSPPPSPPSPPSSPTPPLNPMGPNTTMFIHTKYDGKVFDYDDTRKRVYMHDLHRGANQKFYIETSNVPMYYRIKVDYLGDDECLDWSDKPKLSMHKCHENSNQQWFFTSGSELGEQPLFFTGGIGLGEANDVRIRVAYSPEKCLDYAENDGRLYLNEVCHSGNNQRFYFNFTRVEEN